MQFHDVAHEREPEAQPGPRPSAVSSCARREEHRDLSAESPGPCRGPSSTAAPLSCISRTSTCPSSGVNFTAFDTRCQTARRSRSGSPATRLTSSSLSNVEHQPAGRDGGPQRLHHRADNLGQIDVLQRQLQLPPARRATRRTGRRSAVSAPGRDARWPPAPAPCCRRPSAPFPTILRVALDRRQRRPQLARQRRQEILVRVRRRVGLGAGPAQIRRRRCAARAPSSPGASPTAESSTPADGITGDSTTPRAGHQPPRAAPQKRPSEAAPATPAHVSPSRDAHERQQCRTAMSVATASTSGASAGRLEEIALQQVVRHRRLHLDADEARVVRRRHELLRSESGGADEHDLVAEGVWRDAIGHHVGRGHERERCGRTSKPQQQVGAAVERHGALAERSDDALALHGSQRRRPPPRAPGARRRGRATDRPRRSAAITQRHAAQRAVAVRRRVEKPRTARRAGRSRAGCTPPRRLRTWAGRLSARRLRRG